MAMILLKLPIFYRTIEGWLLSLYTLICCVLSCLLPRPRPCTDFSGSRSSVVTKETFELYKNLVSKAISAMKKMTKHAESVVSLKEKWAPYISRCDSIYRQIFERLTQVKTDVSLELHEPIEDISLRGYSIRGRKCDNSLAPKMRNYIK